MMYITKEQLKKSRHELEIDKDFQQKLYHLLSERPWIILAIKAGFNPFDINEDAKKAFKFCERHYESGWFVGFHDGMEVIEEQYNKETKE